MCRPITAVAARMEASGCRSSWATLAISRSAGDDKSVARSAVAIRVPSRGPVASTPRERIADGFNI